MEVKIVLSDDCDECFNHRGGQCMLDAKRMFYCQNGKLQIDFSYSHITFKCFLIFLHIIENVHISTKFKEGGVKSTALSNFLVLIVMIHILLFNFKE